MKRSFCWSGASADRLLYSWPLGGRRASQHFIEENGAIKRWGPTKKEDRRRRPGSGPLVETYIRLFMPPAGYVRVRGPTAAHSNPAGFTLAAVHANSSIHVTRQQQHERQSESLLLCFPVAKSLSQFIYYGHTLKMTHSHFSPPPPPHTPPHPTTPGGPSPHHGGRVIIVGQVSSRL